MGKREKRFYDSQEELANSERFTLTDTPGPDVLILTGTLLDIVSLVPPERGGRNDG